MVKKFDVITKLYEEATQEVTESPEKWIAFLQSASKNYRLPFDEQLLIHVQRPEATAVLPMEKWNEKFGRWVKRDSKGIAVFDKASFTGSRCSSDTLQKGVPRSLCLPHSSHRWE